MGPLGVEAATAGRLIERDTDVGALVQAIDEARNGAGSLVVVEGPAGIGKSRLLQAAREAARERGFAVLSARGGELERGFPFSVVRQLFEAPLASAGGKERETLLDGAAALAAPALGLDAAEAESDTG